MTTAVDQPTTPAAAAGSHERSPRDPDLHTVLLPCRNGGPLLAEQLESLARQQFDRRWELLVVDNGSTDGSAHLAQRYADRIPGLRVIDAGTHRGKPQAINAVVPEVRGGRLIMVDADDVLDGGFLAAMARALDEHSFIGGRMDPSVVNPPWLRRRRRDVQADGLEVGLRHLPFVTGAALGVRAEAFEEVGGYDPDFLRNQDVDLSWRLQYAGHRPVFVPDAVVHYRYRSGLGEIFAQERGYARYSTLLYAKHRRHGMPPRRLRSTVRAWLELLVAVPAVVTAAGRARLVTRAGAVLGRIEGSRRHRVWFV